jgi:hypothetical protein
VVETSCRSSTAEDGARHPKKDLCVFREGLDVKYIFVERNRRRWPISRLFEVLDMGPSGFHRWRQRAAQNKPRRGRTSNDVLLAHVKAIHAEVKAEYGWRARGKSWPRAAYAVPASL